MLWTIAALALWLRCQRAYRELGIKKDRPKITRSNIVCAEPTPGEAGLLDEFLKTLHEDRLEALIRRVMQVPESTRVRATRAMADSLCELVRPTATCSCGNCSWTMPCAGWRSWTSAASGSMSCS